MPLPMVSTAAIMRPSRAKNLSASWTIRAFGVAERDAARMLSAIVNSLTPVLIAHNVMKAAADERLMPARQ